jgi:PAS domain S-box-containing protein
MMKKQLKHLAFPMQLTKRVYFLTIPLVCIPMVLLSIIIWISYLENEKIHRGEELTFLAAKLDREVVGSFDDILKRKQGLDLPLEKQVNLLHGELQPIIDNYSSFHPSISFGFYSKAHDRILAIGPEFKNKFLENSVKDYPYSNLFAATEPELEYRTSSIYWEGEPVLAQVFPIYRGGNLIGYTWASIKMSEIYNELLGTTIVIFFVGSVILGMSILVLWILFHRIRRSLTSFAQTIVSNSRESKAFDLLPELNPILDLIKNRTDELIEANNRLKQAIQIKDKAEKELQQSEERFSKAFAASPSLMCIIDCKTDFFVEVNDSLLEKTGYTREELEGKTWREVVQWIDPESGNTFESKFRKGERIHNIEAGFYSRIGEACYGLFSIEPIILNERVSLLCVVTDITESKHFSQELMKLDRLNLIGQMAAGISHEIRNPMTTVRGFLQMLGEKEDAQKYQDYYQIMIEELDRANTIITEFLSISRNKFDEQKLQNLNSILYALAPLIEADAVGQEKNLMLELGEIPRIYVNEKEIRQVVLNLSRNGLEAMEKGGRLLLKTFEAMGEVILVVRDSGAGMSPELMHKLGTPFFTTKDSGTGLGLAVCYGIIARHNAKMTVNSGSWGTEFQIHFSIEQKKNAQ